MKKFLVVMIIVTFTTIYAETFKGVKFSIIEKKSVPNIKLSLDIRLDQKVDKEFLKEFAINLKKSEKAKFKNIFICYFLPDMEVGSGAWATTHFNPDLRVEIIGMTLEQEKQLKPDKLDPSSEILGMWKDETPGAGSIWTIFKRSNKLFVSKKYQDGGKSETEIIQKKQADKLRYQDKEENTSGTYFLVEKNGDLSVLDNYGFIKLLKVTK